MFRLFEIVVRPLSGFGSPLKGDTLFGQFCWQAAYDPSLLHGGLDRWIAEYSRCPFLIFSSAWPRFQLDGKLYYALKRPDLPLSMLFPSSSQDKREQLARRKEHKRKGWMVVGEDLSLELSPNRYLDGKSLSGLMGSWSDPEASFAREMDQSHNTINRTSLTTGEGMFAPFLETAIHYAQGVEMAVFVLADDEAIELDAIKTAFGRIGRFGFGRNASTGQGRFEMGEHREIRLTHHSSHNACYTLAPSVPERNSFSDVFFVPFVRFGKHGDRLARSSSPFKNPVIMADEGAVLVPGDGSVFGKPYVGRAVMDISKAMTETVAQGYSIYLPFRMEI